MKATRSIASLWWADTRHYWIVRLGRKYDVHLVSTSRPPLWNAVTFKHVPVDRHQSVVSELLAKAGRNARIAVIPYTGFTLPSSLRATAAQ